MVAQKRAEEYAAAQRRAEEAREVVVEAEVFTTTIIIHTPVINISFILQLSEADLFHRNRESLKGRYRTTFHH